MNSYFYSRWFRKEKKMLGVVFCGGKSLRMGRDKGLMLNNGRTWATIAAEKLAELNIPICVSINAQQVESYKQLFAEVMLLVDEESLALKGPLLGLLSAHTKHPAEDLFILACDLPLMEVWLLKRLAAATLEAPDCEAFVFSNAGSPEPLCAIYKSTGLRKVITELQANRLSSFSMKSLLSLLKVFELQVSEKDQEALENFNTHDLI
jgi:molybdopterin-guanine dinucleotide biosynthesis protein A